MNEFYWFKAMPGVYHLYDRPRKFGEITGGYDYRKPVAKVWRGDDGKYRYDTIGIEGVGSGVFTRTAPWTAVVAVQRLITVATGAANFTRENF